MGGNNNGVNWSSGAPDWSRTTALKSSKDRVAGGLKDTEEAGGEVAGGVREWVAGEDKYVPHTGENTG